MPKGSQALTHARREEIVNACALLYETMGFKEITIKDIAAATSFTRTSIYNYFQTKEEIFLALLQHGLQTWRPSCGSTVRWTLQPLPKSSPAHWKNAHACSNWSP